MNNGLSIMASVSVALMISVNTFAATPIRNGNLDNINREYQKLKSSENNTSFSKEDEIPDSAYDFVEGKWEYIGTSSN